MAIADARLDPRFAESPSVVGAPNIRYDAGVPVRVTQANGDAVAVGMLCVLDNEPRKLCAADLDTLLELACVAEAFFEARMVVLRAADIAEERRLMVEHLERERRQFKRAERMADMGSWRYDLDQSSAGWSDGVFAIHELPISGEPLRVCRAFDRGALN